MEYGLRLEDNLFRLQEELLEGRYRHGAYRPFTVFDPKKRSIHKATVRDRIMHQAVVNVIEPLFERRFIHDSYSCRKGKGTHAAVRRLRRFLLRASRNDSCTVWALKCDVRKFFASIDHRILIDLLQRRVPDGKALDLIERVIGSFSTAPGKGLPLGNLTSQLFANVYLHELDRFVKFALQENHYLRYCDDFIIVDGSRQRIEGLIRLISMFLRTRLALDLHPDKVSVRTWSQGIDFLGYVLLPHCSIVRTKTVKRMLTRVEPDNLFSYLGLCAHASSHKLEQLLLNKAMLGAGRSAHGNLISTILYSISTASHCTTTSALRNQPAILDKPEGRKLGAYGYKL